LSGHGHRLERADIVLIAVGAIVAAAIGVLQGMVMHLEARGGTLWAQMPRRSLWLWLGLIASRVVIDLVASGVGAHVAASATTILLTLGINRLSQAAVVAPRALAAGIPFAPEKNGATFLGNVFGPSHEQSRIDTSSSLSAPHAERTTSSEWQSGVRLLAERLAARGR
jgi:hypothetical protein